MLTGHLVFLFAKSGNHENRRCEHPEVGQAGRGPSTAWRLPWSMWWEVGLEAEAEPGACRPQGPQCAFGSLF